MEIRKLDVQNFRGIRQLSWSPTRNFVCLVGPGDSCKSTVLDAIEFALAPRWVQFTDVDFAGGDTAQPIVIEVTVASLPAAAMAENRFGLYLRGWSATGVLNDEPQDGDAPVVTVRLTVDASLDPNWELINARQAPRPLSLGERRIFGVVRLGDDAERHLGWSQGSALTKLTDQQDDAATRLAAAYRTARRLVDSAAIPGLSAIADEVNQSAKRIGAYTPVRLSPGLDTQRASMSLGTLALHGDGIPLRLSGLGSRRLVSLAIQQMSVPDGAIVLIDELEHGLEPHRILHALRTLKWKLANQVLQGTDYIGQVFLTTHSAVSIIELNAADLQITRRSPQGHSIAAAPTAVQPLLRSMPEAFLATRVVVCEGRTEVGLLRAFRDFWTARHAGTPPEHWGAVFVDGKGSNAHNIALSLRTLGYAVLLFRDSDVALPDATRTALQQSGVVSVEYAGATDTERRMISDLSPAGLGRLIDVLYELYSDDTVQSMLARDLNQQVRLPADHRQWAVVAGSDAALRNQLATTAKRLKWFKSMSAGEPIGRVLVEDLQAGLNPPIANTFSAIERWIYA